MKLPEALGQLGALHPFSLRRKMVRHNERFDLPATQSALLRDIRCGSLDFLELYRSCRQVTRMPLEGGDKFLFRPLKALTLLRLFERIVEQQVPGGIIECGVYRGFSALLLANAARAHWPDYDGARLYLVDSFEGLSESTPHDEMVWVDEPSGTIRHGQPTERFAANTFDHVAAAFEPFPEATLCKGWIPAVFEQLPAHDWAFVHVDVDLHDPTLACLDYFWDRLSPGGVIVCDDYLTPLYPGAMKAWEGFCTARGLDYLILDTGQAVLEKPGTPTAA